MDLFILIAILILLVVYMFKHVDYGYSESMPTLDNGIRHQIVLTPPKSKKILISHIKESESTISSGKKYIFQIRKSVDGDIWYYDGKDQYPMNGNPCNTRDYKEAFFVYKRENADEILTILNEWTVGWDYSLREYSKILEFKNN